MPPFFKRKPGGGGRDSSVSTPLCLMGTSPGWGTPTQMLSLSSLNRHNPIECWASSLGGSGDSWGPWNSGVLLSHTDGPAGHLASGGSLLGREEAAGVWETGALDPAVAVPAALPLSPTCPGHGEPCGPPLTLAPGSNSELGTNDIWW